MSDVVFTNGCFDLIHAGHVDLLRECFWAAKRLTADTGRRHVIIIGLNSDDSVRRLKGPTRPLMTFEQRRDVLLSIRFVDHVIKFDDDTPLELIKTIRPVLLVKGEEYRETGIIGSEYAGGVMFVKRRYEISTTKILKGR